MTSGKSFSLVGLSVLACNMGREDSEEVSTVSASAGMRRSQDGLPRTLCVTKSPGGS